MIHRTSGHRYGFKQHIRNPVIGTRWDLLGPVRTCWDLQGVVAKGRWVSCSSSKDLRVPSQVTAALAEALRKVVSRDVFLRPLADKFARLALQLAARYASWLRGGLSGGESNGDSAAKVSDGVSDTQQVIALLLIELLTCPPSCPDDK